LATVPSAITATPAFKGNNSGLEFERNRERERERERERVNACEYVNKQHTYHESILQEIFQYCMNIKKCKYD